MTRTPYAAECRRCCTLCCMLRAMSLVYYMTMMLQMVSSSSAPSLSRDVILLHCRRCEFGTQHYNDIQQRGWEGNLNTLRTRSAKLLVSRFILITLVCSQRSARSASAHGWQLATFGQHTTRDARSVVNFCSSVVVVDVAVDVVASLATGICPGKCPTSVARCSARMDMRGDMRGPALTPSTHDGTNNISDDATMR